MTATTFLPQRTVKKEAENRATRIAVATFAGLAALAGLEHGIGEILQGFVAPPAVVFESWPDTSAFEVLSGEPAMSLIPNLAVTGVLTILVAVALGVWAVRFLFRPRGGGVLIGLSVLLLLVGGGLAPPLIGLLVGVTALRLQSSHLGLPSRIAIWLAPAWGWLLAVTVFGYLSLVPGVVVANALTGFESAWVVAGLGLGSFAALILSLIAARAHDRIEVGSQGLGRL